MSRAPAINKSLYDRIAKIESALRNAGIKPGAAKPITSWIDFDLPLSTGWVPFGTPYASPGFFKDVNGLVHLRGVIKNGDVGTLYQMDPGNIPDAEVVTNAYGAGSRTCRVDVHTDGTIEIVSIGTDSSLLSLDGVYYRAAQ